MLLILAARKYRHHKQRKQEEQQARLATTTTYDAAPALVNFDLKHQVLATETNTNTNTNVNIKPARGCCLGRRPRHQQRRQRCCQKSSGPSRSRDLLQELDVKTETVGAGASAAVLPHRPAVRGLVVVDKTSATGQPRSFDNSTKGRFTTASSSEMDLPTYDEEDKNEVDVDDAYGRVEGHGLLIQEDVEGGLLPPYTELKG